MNEEQVRQIIKEELSGLLKSDRYTFQKHIQLLDANDISFGSNKGTRIGTSTSQKIGFYAKTPINQSGAISAPTGGATQDTEARIAINSIRTVLINLGLTA